MRNSLLILAFSSAFITANAQSDWAFHVSAEETVTNGDSKSTLNFLSFTQLAANSGMRAGFYYTKDNSLAAEITLGVVGTSRTDEWFTKIVPIEIVGHYNIVPLINNSSPYKFNADLGIGSGLVRAHSDTYNANGRFGWSEHLSAGASLDIPVKDLAIVSFGLRNTWFIDDYIDATPVDGTGNDQMLRFFTATRVNLGPSAKFKSELAEAKSMANSLSNDLTQAKADAQAASEQAEAKQATQKAEIDRLTAELATANKQTYVLQSVHFEKNQSVIRPQDIPELMSLLSILNSNTNLSAIIVGHTDKSGPQEFNQKLSLQRAEAVKSWLVEKGVSSERLETKGESYSNPMLPNSDEDARAVNRRTEIILN